MVSVPVTPGRSVQVQGAPRERFQYAESRNLVGRAMEQAGAALGGAAEDLQRTKEIYDDAAVKKADLAATNEKRELLWTGPEAFFSKQGFAAGNARPTVEEAIAKINERYASELKNDTQKGLFSRVASQRDGSDLERIAAHSTKEYSTEFEIVSTARKEAFQADAVRYSDDPAAYAEQIAGGLNEIDALAQQQGWGEDRQRAEEEKFISGAHFMSINSMLAGNRNDDAIAFFEKNRNDMLPREEMAVLEKLTPVIEFREDELEVTTALASAPTVEAGAPATGSSLSVQLSAIESNESGGKQFGAGGKTLTSSAGALGVMQVMPGTGPEAARLAGLPWSLEKMKTDPAYNRALGAAYYKEQLRRFGDPAMAAAAYNAGPGAMQSAKLKARKAGSPDDWVRYLPAETRDYVAKFQRKTGTASASAGDGGSTTNFSGAYAALEAKATQEKWAPEVLERRRKRLDQRVDREVQLQKLQENEQWDVSLETVDALGASFTSISQIPNYDRLPPERRMQLRNMAESNLAGTKVAADGDTAINLSRMAIQAPDDFMKVDLREYKHRVSPSEYAQLQDSQARLVAKPDQEKSLIESVNGAITFFSTPEQKLSGEKNKLRRNRVANAMLIYLRKNVDPKRSPTDTERRQAFGWAVGEVDGKIRADREVYDVPAQFIQAYGAEQKRLTGRWPLDSQIQDAYRRSQGGK